MDNVQGIIALVIMLSVLVVAHEWGHFIVAKLFKMRVEEFSLFFGPILAKVGHRNGTDYNIRSVPLGGFVRIAGMEPDDISGGRPVLEAIRNPRFAEEKSVASLMADLATEAGAGIDFGGVSLAVLEKIQAQVNERAELRPDGRDALRTLRDAPTTTEDERKLIDMVLAADARATDQGLYSRKPIYQRALVIFAGPFMSLLFGFLIYCAMGMTIGVPRRATTRVLDVNKTGAGYAAGLRSLDTIVSINGEPMKNGDAMIDIIHNSAGKQLQLRVKRNQQYLNLTATPRPTTIQGKTVGLLGFSPDADYMRCGPVESVVRGYEVSVNTVTTLLSTLFSRKVKDNVGGPIAMAQMSIIANRMGPAYLVSMTAMLSLTLGIMNLIPIPILDGGHLLLLAVEKFRRRKLTPREVYSAQMVGFGVLAIIISLVMYNDIYRLVTGKLVP